MTKNEEIAYWENYLYVVKDSKPKHMNQPIAKGLQKMYSPLGALVYVGDCSYNHHLCEWAWSKEDGIVINEGARWELFAEWLALHDSWQEFIEICEDHEEVREHIRQLRESSSLRLKIAAAIGSVCDLQLQRAEAICMSIDASIACREALA
jgi:hypothetical protein